MENKPTSRTRIARLGKFGIIGLFNTLLDFVIYNLLADHMGLGLIEANIISTTAAMAFSFFANKKLVFKKHDGHIVKQAVAFYSVTAFGLYVLQTGTIALLTQVWFWPMHHVLLFCHLAGITTHDDFIVRNGAKAIATVISLSWNYVMYKKVVFK